MTDNLPGAALVFMDTETTGLALDDDIWEFAAIRREPDGSESRLHLFINHGCGGETGRCQNLPEPFLADHIARYDGQAAYEQFAAASAISIILKGRPHIVGAVPNFDTERLALLLRQYGHEPTWHYHLIDVENLAVGYLLGKTGKGIPLPWDSDDLSRACGVEPPTTTRHTAMGDAEWCRDLYDAIHESTP